MAEEENEELWYRKIGFFNNPFSIKPAPFDFRIVGQDDILDELVYKIPAGTMSFVEGNLGTGKSTIMKHLIHRFKGKGQVIFFSCNRIDTDLNIEQLLIDKYGFWGRMFKAHPKNMIVLLDEAQELTQENTERIKYFFDQGNIKSVVFAGTKYNDTKFHDSVKERIGDGVLKLKNLSEEEAVSLIRNRIGNLNLLSDDIVKKLFKLAKENPRRLLQRCDRACRHIVENGEQEFTESHFDKLFGEEPKEEVKEKKVAKKPKKKTTKKTPKAPKKEDSEEDLHMEEKE
ncbi:MAG: hypothetical protein CMH62_00415 [Nanoarchaeota archaeon]|nr:hypothetical protein [Nanoarchaeota archaeon]